MLALPTQESPHSIAFDLGLTWGQPGPSFLIRRRDGPYSAIHEDPLGTWRETPRSGKVSRALASVGSRVPAFLLFPLAVTLLAAAPPHDTSDSFLNFLANRDLVVKGTVVDILDGDRPYEGSCRVPAWGRFIGRAITVKIDTVLFGTVEDSVVVIHTLLRPPIPSLRSGAIVLGWARRNPNDAWRLYGNVVVYDADGFGHFPVRGVLESGGPSTLASYEALPMALSARMTLNGHASFKAARAVALVRVISIGQSINRKRAVRVDHLGWVAGSAPIAPEDLILTDSEVCLPEIAPGDSLIIPVTAVSASTPVRLFGCPTAYEVKCGFLPGFGVDLNASSRVFGTTAGHITVASRLRRP